MTLDLLTFAKRYTAAWCSQSPASVASFFSPNGSLTINDGLPSVGRASIAAAAQEFMAAFPDLKVMMNGVSVEGDRAIYSWTLEGHNTGPSGTGAFVRISGFEQWRIEEDGLIADSLGHFDTDEWHRQIQRGAFAEWPNFEVSDTFCERQKERRGSAHPAINPIIAAR